ncbi:MAG: P-loop NTPase [bacterium]|nr:P-loop NTPase [bacterium]
MDTNNNSSWRLLKTVKDRWFVVVCIFLSISVLGTYIIWLAARTYSATAVLLVHSQQKDVIDMQSLQTVERINSTIAQLATQESVVSKVENITGNYQSNVSAWPVKGTEFINITAIDSSPESAQRLANTTVDVLLDRVNWLQEKQPLGISVEVVEKAVAPPIPSSTSKKVQAVGVVIFAIFCSIFSAGITESLDRRVREEDVETELQLAIIGKTNKFHHSHTGSLRSRDSFKQLQSTMQFLKFDEPTNAIAFTGTSPGEGKSSTIANLALAFHNVGQDVIIADLDFRRPTMHRLFDIANSSKSGLSNILLSTSNFPDPVQTKFKHISVYPAGIAAPDDAARIYQSPRLRELTEKMRDSWLLIDLPPLLLVPGAATVASVCKNTVFVIEPAKTKLRDAKACLAILRRANVNIVGAILTKVKGINAYYSKDEY